MQQLNNSFSIFIFATNTQLSNNLRRIRNADLLILHLHVSIQIVRHLRRAMRVLLVVFVNVDLHSYALRTTWNARSVHRYLFKPKT